MTDAQVRRRGAPLVTLAVVLGCWIVLRSFTWAAIGSPLEGIGGRAAQGHLRPVARTEETVHDAGTEVVSTNGLAAWQPFEAANIYGPLPRQNFTKLLGNRTVAVVQAAPENLFSPDVLTANQLASAPLSTPANTARPAADALPSVVSGTPSKRRLSLDAWLFLRDSGQESGLMAFRPATLGASQAGAIIRYDLRPASDLKFNAYLRASKALIAQGESEAAAGLAVQPLQEVPVTLHAEARITARSGDAAVRPTVFATAGLQQKLAGVEARGYAQAGYVGGEFSTAFADAQFIAEKRIINVSQAPLRMGLGAWGGAQKDAARLDIGPAASVELNAIGAPIRVGASYRQRIAGSAQPDSGFALTVITGF